jgi:formate dehydrogenase maturation protein FdhE
MKLLDVLGKQLDEEAKGNATPPENINSRELYEQLLEKKVKEMEKMFNDKLNSLIEQMKVDKKEDVTPTVETVEEGEKNDSNSELSVSE